MRSHSASVPASNDAPNQDCCFCDDTRGLYLVCDGLGSYRGGEIASALVAETCARALETPPGFEGVQAWLKAAAKEAARALHERGKKDPRLKSMASTLTLLTIRDATYHVLHVGDSRGYVQRGGRLEQITRDHSIAFEQYLAGAITKEQISTHPNQRMLTRTFAATRSFVIPDMFSGSVQGGDRFLLCSDGLTKVVSDPEVLDILRDDEPESTCAHLIQLAVERQAEDDVTAVVVAVSP